MQHWILNFSIESIYATIVFIMCMIIFFKTKSAYDLTGYKGLRYFSLAFLFLGLSYVFRFIFRFVFRFISDVRPHGLMHPPGMEIGQALFIYTSTVAAFFLLYSVLWKRWKKKDFSTHIYVIGLIFTAIYSLFFHPVIHILLLSCIFIAASFFSFLSQKKHSKLFLAYVLLSLFWTLNVLALEIPKFMIIPNLAIYVTSLLVFFLILLRVIKIK